MGTLNSKITKLIEYTLSIPKSIFVNLYYFPIKQAIRFPILISYKIKLDSLGQHNAISIRKGSRVKVGFDSSFDMERKGWWHIGENGKISFKGNALFGRGIILVVDGNLTIGNDFSINANSLINCGKLITIGDYVMCGWNTNILDGDGHQIFHAGKADCPMYDEIFIGSQCWLSANTTVLKGSNLKKNSIVATGTLVSKVFHSENILIGGNNKILRTDVSWKK